MNQHPSPVYDIPAGWRDVLADELAKPYFADLAKFIDAERAGHEVYPAAENVYNALRHTPYDRVRVLLLGQDPYHDIGQAHGLCFSVSTGTKLPPSLVNIFKELKTDVGVPTPKHGCLTKWADQGVLLLNAVLTVRAHQPNSHKDRGWEKFTDAVIAKVNEKTDPVVFVLWGGYAQKKERLIDTGRHTVIKFAHPSPCRPATASSGANRFPRSTRRFGAGQPAIEWSLE